MIYFNNVSKKFILNRKQYLTVKDVFIQLIKNDIRISNTSVEIIKNLNLKIEKGDVVGIIGSNGAGKSTLLKMVSNIITPDSGKITVDGSIAPLLEIGLGFNPDLTGRENVYLYGSLLGRRRKEIDGLMDEIVEFSELADFIDVPIKNYSSGMHMRLAFSIATSVDADIIILDEVFSVGDAHFQEKSMKRMTSYKDRGKTMLIVSHDLNMISSFCDKILYIKPEGTYEYGDLSLIDQYIYNEI